MTTSSSRFDGSLRALAMLATLIAAVTLLPVAAQADPLPAPSSDDAIRAHFTDPWQPPNDPQAVDRPDTSYCNDRAPIQGDAASLWVTDEWIYCANDVRVEERIGLRGFGDFAQELWYLPDHYYVLECSTPHYYTETFACWDFG